VRFASRHVGNTRMRTVSALHYVDVPGNQFANRAWRQLVQASLF
jgi:hypothetical protein